MNNIKILLYNATGLRKKLENIRSYNEKMGIHISLITETWFKNNNWLTKDIKAASFCDAENNRGMAGTCSIVNENIVIQKLNNIIVDNVC